jgi:hypothetical protein
VAEVAVVAEGVEAEEAEAEAAEEYISRGATNVEMCTPAIPPSRSPAAPLSLYLCFYAGALLLTRKLAEFSGPSHGLQVFISLRRFYLVAI